MKNLILICTLMALVTGGSVLIAQDEDQNPAKQQDQTKQQIKTKSKEQIREKSNEETADQQHNQYKYQTKTQTKEQVKEMSSDGNSDQQRSMYKYQSKTQTKEQVKDGSQTQLMLKTQTKEQAKEKNSGEEKYQYMNQEKTATETKMQRKNGFVDADGDGINDHVNDPSGNGVKNGQDENFEPGQNGLGGQQMHKNGEINGKNMRKSGTQNNNLSGEGLGTGGSESKGKQGTKNGKK